ncbi:MAG: hypothetical protein LBL60_01580 [Mycoplasmataceae bacterium]|jgi:hypothetical protein|nr:hypothetical protein [Mycoplasmataceae bacterium]
MKIEKINFSSNVRIDKTTTPIIVYIYNDICSFIENFLMFSKWFSKDEKYVKKNEQDSWHIDIDKTIDNFAQENGIDVQYKYFRKLEAKLNHCDLEKFTTITNQGLIQSKERKYLLSEYFPNIIKLYNSIVDKVFDNFVSLEEIKKPFERFSQNHINKEIYKAKTIDELIEMEINHNNVFCNGVNDLLKTFKIYE